MLATIEPKPAAALVSPSALLSKKIAALRRRQVSISAGTGAALVLAVALVLLAIEMGLDWWMDLTWGARAALLALNLGIIVYFVARHVFQPILHQPDDDTLALLVEKAQSEFRSRLIASVQLTQPDGIPAGESPELVRAMVRETESLALPIDFEQFVKTDPLKRAGGLALIIFATGLFGFIAGGKASVDLFKRAFLSSAPVPRKTRIVGVTGHLRVGRGDTVTVEAVARGVIPRSGRLVVRSPLLSRLAACRERPDHALWQCRHPPGPARLPRQRASGGDEFR